MLVVADETTRSMRRTANSLFTEWLPFARWVAKCSLFFFLKSRTLLVHKVEAKSWSMRCYRRYKSDASEKFKPACETKGGEMKAERKMRRNIFVARWAMVEIYDRTFSPSFCYCLSREPFPFLGTLGISANYDSVNLFNRPLLLAARQ